MTTAFLVRSSVAALLAAMAPACDGKTRCTDCEPAKVIAAVKSMGATPTTTKLQPWETFNEGFNGCAGGCGMRMAGPSQDVATQPGAMIGQTTYCPVSAVAFEIKPTSVTRRVGDKTLYFCCESCAAYFTANQAAVLTARGIAA